MNAPLSLLDNPFDFCLTRYHCVKSARTCLSRQNYQAISIWHWRGAPGNVAKFSQPVVAHTSMLWLPVTDCTGRSQTCVRHTLRVRALLSAWRPGEGATLHPFPFALSCYGAHTSNGSALFSRFMEVGMVRNSHLAGNKLGKLRNGRTYLLAFPAVGHRDMSDPIRGVIYQRSGVGEKGLFRQYTYGAVSQSILDECHRLGLRSTVTLPHRTDDSHVFKVRANPGALQCFDLVVQRDHGFGGSAIEDGRNEKMRARAKCLDFRSRQAGRTVDDDEIESSLHDVRMKNFRKRISHVGRLQQIAL